MVNFPHLNLCLIRDQPQVFPMGEDIRQQLGLERVVWITMDALTAYFQIRVAKADQHKTMFMLPGGRYFFRKTVMENRLRSNLYCTTVD